MVSVQKYNYWLLEHGDEREVLFDTEKDPGELINCAQLPEYAKTLEEHRAMLKDHSINYHDHLTHSMLDALI